MSYRPDIDGLRAVAVLPVVLFHAFPRYLPGGFVGVDIFFVISGFLISGVIFDQLKVGTFSIVEFYARRVRRLFPALMIVLTAVFAVGWWLQYPDEFQRTGQQIVASAGFIANIYFWQHSNYFAPAASTYPLLHIWSLGVEEQFYVAWPLTLLVLARRPQLVGPVIIVTFFGSLALSITYFVHGPAAFYLPFTRAWELMLGAGLAWYSRSYPAAESSLSPLPSRSRG